MNSLQDFSDEVISFPVPKRYLPVVIRALAKAMEDDDVRPTIHRDEGLTHLQGQHNEAATIDWTNVESCKNLRQQLRYPGALAMLNLTAARPNEFISFQEVVLASEQSEKQVRAELGALTKAIKRLYDVSRDDAIWPVEVRWAAGGEEQAYYLMRPEIARAWTQSEK